VGGTIIDKDITHLFVYSHQIRKDITFSALLSLKVAFKIDK